MITLKKKEKMKWSPFPFLPVSPLSLGTWTRKSWRKLSEPLRTSIVRLVYTGNRSRSCDPAIPIRGMQELLARVAAMHNINLIWWYNRTAGNGKTFRKSIQQNRKSLKSYKIGIYNKIPQDKIPEKTPQTTSSNILIFYWNTKKSLQVYWGTLS